MRKVNSLLLQTAIRGFASLGILLMLMNGAGAAPLIKLEGTAMGTRDASESELSLSLLSWSSAEQITEVADAFKDYQASMDQEKLVDVIGEQETLGYLFTHSSVGYSIKYAWQDDSNGTRQMVFLVEPGLKTRNPVIWTNKSTDDRPFALVEMQWDGDTAIVKTSLEGEIGLNGDGKLHLSNFDEAEIFGNMADSTPYYL